MIVYGQKKSYNHKQYECPFVNTNVFGFIEIQLMITRKSKQHLNWKQTNKLATGQFNIRFHVLSWIGKLVGV